MKILTQKEQNEISNLLHNLWLNKDKTTNSDFAELIDNSIERLDKIISLDDENIRSINFYYK